MKKDFLGNELFVGDEVLTAYENPTKSLAFNQKCSILKE